jgi:hypothetical protein
MDENALNKDWCSWNQTKKNPKTNKQKTNPTTPISKKKIRLSNEKKNLHCTFILLIKAMKFNSFYTYHQTITNKLFPKKNSKNKQIVLQNSTQKLFFKIQPTNCPFPCKQFLTTQS